MISDNLQKQIVEAMKAKDSTRVETLKMLSSALKNAEIEKKREKLTEEEELNVVQKEAKKRKDAIEAYKKGGAEDRARKEEDELEILKKYLPEEMSDNELEKLVDDLIEQSSAKTMSDMGRVMGMVMSEVGTRADGNRVSAIVKSKLS